jgi:hypothetical protein
MCSPHLNAFCNCLATDLVSTDAEYKRHAQKADLAELIANAQAPACTVPDSYWLLFTMLLNAASKTQHRFEAAQHSLYHYTYSQVPLQTQYVSTCWHNQV